MFDVILGSQSPRRKDILNYLNILFKQSTPPFDEEKIIFEGDPIKYVNQLSRGKSASLVKEKSNALLITADTIVYCEGKVYNKPHTSQEALEYLLALQGRWHSVYTSVTVNLEGTSITEVEETRLLFHPLSVEKIQAYHNLVTFEDKAGGYTIQGPGALIVKQIEGCFYNVLGLPPSTLQQLLSKLNIDLWDYTLKK
ncbi:MAG: maf [Chlamydiales bacterium]|nr:maf [Chlamydiales bacterium]